MQNEVVTGETLLRDLSEALSKRLTASDRESDAIEPAIADIGRDLSRDMIREVLGALGEASAESLGRGYSDALSQATMYAPDERDVLRWAVAAYVLSL